MNTEDTKPIKEETVVRADEEKTVEAPSLDLPKQGWFFSNTGEGTPFGVEAKTYEEAVEANRRHLDAENKHKEKH